MQHLDERRYQHVRVVAYERNKLLHIAYWKRASPTAALGLANTVRYYDYNSPLYSFSPQVHGWRYGLLIDITSTNGGVAHFRQRNVIYDELGFAQDDDTIGLPVIDTRPNIIDIVDAVERSLNVRTTRLLESRKQG